MIITIIALFYHDTINYHDIYISQHESMVAKNMKSGIMPPTESLQRK